jgi:pimeloyl-ACP methyl ester carboxylesterase
VQHTILNKAFKIKGSQSKLITADLTHTKTDEEMPLVVFAHGFMGFKDWGGWPLAAEIFASKQLPFFKFNFSHNSTTPQHLTEFTDLAAFGNNNFKIEYDDLGVVLDFIEKKGAEFDFNWNGEIYLIGHSRGGAICLLRAAQDERVTKVCTWASVSDLERYLELKDFKAWQEEGVHTITNGRTKQEMPIYFQFIAAYAENLTTLSMANNLEKIVCPVLLVHGLNDTVVPLSDAHILYQEMQHALISEIENGDHTFGMKHPLTERKITKAFADVLSETMEFFNL